MLEFRNLGTPDEVRTFPHGRVEIVRLSGLTLGRATLEPGWRWSQDIKPIVNTDSCEVPHSSVVLSGRLHVRMDDGGEADLGAGDAHRVGPGHDGWVVGDEPCVVIDVLGAEAYATNGAAAESVRSVTCPPCGVTFSVAPSVSVDHLVAAVQEHARVSHGAELTREQILEDVTTVAPALAVKA